MPLTERQRIGAALIAGGHTGVRVATELGVCQNTISLWRRLPDFQIEINRQQQMALSDARGRLLEAAHAAIERLLSLCTQTDNQEVSLQAAKSLLNHCRILPDGASLGIEAVTGATPPKLSSEEISIVQALEDVRSGMYSAHPFVTFMQNHGNLDNDDIDLFLGDFDFLRQEIQEYQVRQP